MKRLQWSRRVPGRSALRILWWDFSRFVSATTLRLLYGLRVRGLEHVPTHGPVLSRPEIVDILSTHEAELPAGRQRHTGV